jgi:hypothetical protein
MATKIAIAPEESRGCPPKVAMPLSGYYETIKNMSSVFKMTSG